jgi:signal transduction histidine kinase
MTAIAPAKAPVTRRFVFLSPTITILGIVGILLLVAVIALIGTMLRQIEANRIATGFNFSTANRPFSQLEHEAMQTLVYVTENPEDFDAARFQQDLDVLASRWEVVFWPTVQAVFPQDIKDNIDEMIPMWDSIQDLSAEWMADPQNEEVHAELAQLLSDFSLLVFQTDVRYQTIRGLTLDNFNQSTENLLVALTIVLVLLVGFVIIAAYAMYRFVQAQRSAEAKTRAALAAESAANETSQFKDQFLAVMSHELRTPLNAIIGFLGIMGMSGKLDERNTHMLQRTRANAERLLILINDILDLSKIEAGRMELVPSAVSPRELVGRWQTQMEVLAKQKDLKFTVTIDPHLPDEIMIDENAVTKIGTNLLSNAFKFTDEGEVSLESKYSDRQWYIIVRDTGIGIPAHMHNHIFESFRQVDNSFKRPYGGTGLGLPIVQHLVKAMNGTVRVDSEPGKGSTFTVTLPVEPVEKAAAPTVSVSQLQPA